MADRDLQGEHDDAAQVRARAVTRNVVCNQLLNEAQQRLFECIAALATDPTNHDAQDRFELADEAAAAALKKAREAAMLVPCIGAQSRRAAAMDEHTAALLMLNLDAQSRRAAIMALREGALALITQAIIDITTDTPLTAATDPSGAAGSTAAMAGTAAMAAISVATTAPAMAAVTTTAPAMGGTAAMAAMTTTGALMSLPPPMGLGPPPPPPVAVAGSGSSSPTSTGSSPDSDDEAKWLNFRSPLFYP